MEEEGLSALARFMAKAKSGAGAIGKYAIDHPEKSTAIAAGGLGAAGLAEHIHNKHEEEEHPLKHFLAKMGVG